jgi:hypothetical protein
LNFLSLLKRNLIYKLKKKINIDLQQNVDSSSLNKLFEFYNTDKADTVYNTIKKTNEDGHGFSKFYEDHLKIFKKNKINILEIGSFSGASAAAFAKFFPYSNVYCLDINLINFKFSSERIHTYGIDSSNNKMMLEFLNKIDFFNKISFFDIIIDDGSHKLSDQLNSLNFFYKYVKKNGYYIIEDYKHPNYFNHLNDVDELKIDEILINLKKKKFFFSKLISSEALNNLINTTEKIFEYKGKSSISNIVFLKKNNF